MFRKCTEVDEEEDEDDEDEDEQDECGGEDEKFQRVWVFDLCEKWKMNSCALFMQCDIRCDGS